MRELEIYIHIPFCVQKCRYCDFLSAPASEDVKTKYMEALVKEIKERSSLYASFLVSTVFFGGGTPSTVEPKWIVEIMGLLKSHFQLSKEAEISMEVNPGTVTKEALMDYRKAGINRLSIGLQSTHDEELKLLGRIHNYEAFLSTYEAAREVGFENINVDLMSALPKQTLESYQESLEKIVNLNPKPEHISAYSLIIEEGTPFYDMYEKELLPLPEEEVEREMYQLTERYLETQGYSRYEISNYALEGKECKHNLGYWSRVNYVGFGIGAASLVENKRFQNTGNLKAYLDNPLMEQESNFLTKEEQMEEFMFLGLRKMEGVSYRIFEKEFGRGMEAVYGPIIEKYVGQGLLIKYAKNGEDYLTLSKKGIDVSNVVMAEFLL